MLTIFIGPGPNRKLGSSSSGRSAARRIESHFSLVLSSKYVCNWFFFGYFQVLNLFLALLLSSFGASNLSAAGGSDDDANKLAEAFNRIGRFKRWVKSTWAKGSNYAKFRFEECCHRQGSARRGKRCHAKFFRASSCCVFFYF